MKTSASSWISNSIGAILPSTGTMDQPLCWSSLRSKRSANSASGRSEIRTTAMHTRASLSRLPAMVLAGLLAAAAGPAPHPAPAQLTKAIRIVAIVNGEPITNDDVDNRARLFALATGLPVSPESLDRLKAQITRQLVDERLRMQEIKRL